jgi:hypothetical protein
MNILRTWGAGRVARWHTNPDMSDSGDYVDGHQGRAAVLAYLLWPDDLVTVAATAVHDQGERGPGDVSYPFKRSNPGIRKALEDAEDIEMGGQGLRPFLLTFLQKERLAFVDRLDCYLWAYYRRPSVLKEASWAAARTHLVAESLKLEVETPIRKLFEQIDKFVRP